MRVRFWHSDKGRETILAEAFKTGVEMDGRDTCDLRRLGEPFTPDCDIAVMCGVKSRDLWREHSRAAIQCIYIDKGYSRHSRPGDSREWEYWRVSVNAHQPTDKFRPDYPTDRRERFEWKPQPWRASGKHILIAGSSAKYHAFYDLKEPTDWTRKLVKHIRGMTQREIVYRPKPSWKDAVPIEGTRFSGGSESITEALKDCHVLLTHGSNACFEAMLAGVPTIVLGNAVAKPISSTSVTDIEKPRMAVMKEREALLAFLSYQQWTLLEFHDGLAWPIIRRQIFE
jgi:hypothetical protein